MISSGMKPNLITFNTLLSLYAKMGDIAGAEKVWEEMISIGLKPDLISFNTLLSLFAKKGGTHFNGIFLLNLSPPFTSKSYIDR